jgi:hypothetical protein
LGSIQLRLEYPQVAVARVELVAVLEYERDQLSRLAFIVSIVAMLKPECG